MGSVNKGVLGVLGVFFGLFAAGGLGGCSASVNRAELRQMPADVAWQELRDKAASAGTASQVSSMVGLGGLAEAYKKTLDDELAKSERAATQASTPETALREMVTDVSSYLTTAIPAHAKAKGTDQYRLNLGMGTLVNRDADPTLNQALALIRNELASQTAFTDQIRILSSNQDRADAILKDLAARNPEIWDATGKTAGSSDYRPETLYIAEGETWVRRDKNNHEVTVTTNITASHPQSRELFSSRVFTRRYFYHPGDSAFITEEENNRRRSTYQKK